MRWCVVMQKIPVVTLPELRPFKMNGFPQTTSSRNVQLRQLDAHRENNRIQPVRSIKVAKDSSSYWRSPIGGEHRRWPIPRKAR
ncbi:hypothetical protein TNCV_4677471 [Trichonephila clavipes]|nr:hypothetical protein TNCV_4677471 [Trichonephila clavipes]